MWETMSKSSTSCQRMISPQCLDYLLTLIAVSRDSIAHKSSRSSRIYRLLALKNFDSTRRSGLSNSDLSSSYGRMSSELMFSSQFVSAEKSSKHLIPLTNSCIWRWSLSRKFLDLSTKVSLVSRKCFRVLRCLLLRSSPRLQSFSRTLCQRLGRSNGKVQRILRLGYVSYAKRACSSYNGFNASSQDSFWATQFVSQICFTLRLSWTPSVRNLLESKVSPLMNLSLYLLLSKVKFRPMVPSRLKIYSYRVVPLMVQKWMRFVERLLK